MNLYYPSNLDILSFLPTKEHKHSQKYLYVIHKIIEHGIHYPDTPCRLNWKVLRDILTSRWDNKVLTSLIEWEIITRYDNYIAGHHSFAYCLTSKYNTTNKSMKLTNKTIINNIKEWKDRSMTDKTIKWLHRNLNKIDVNMDMYSTHIIPSYYAATFLLTDHQKRHIHLAIAKILTKDFFINKDVYGNRIHTNITSLKRELRKCLTVDGEPLVELDIRNSQPFFFSVILKECYPELPEDVKTYIQLTSEGKFYEYMAAALNTPLTPQFKEDLFGRVFFCKKYMNSIYNESIVFSSLFPNVFKVVLQLKSKDKDEFNKRLQNMESHLIIDTITQRIMNERKGMFLTTIHDGIMVKESEADYMKGVMEDEFSKIGLVPSILIK